MTGLYIHIPFCSGKCNYCSFASFKPKTSDITSYLKALANEAYIYRGAKPNTLYIGGGTPSEPKPRDLTAILKTIEKNFKPIKKFRESTFEANPESLTRTKMEILKNFGINRISIGLQTTNNRLLKILGRRHNFKDFLNTFSNLRSAGFNNINIDLMIAIPYQSLSDATQDAKTIISLKPEHISLYGMQIEAGTVFYSQKIKINDDITEKMYKNNCDLFSQNRYNQYEISNFAKSGFECRHNINYWNNGNYLGLGLSAAGYLKGIRKTNICSFEIYCGFDGKNPEKITAEAEKLKGKAKIGETLMLGLRKTDGVKLNFRIEKYFASEIGTLKKQGLLKTRKNRLILTKRGLYLSNIVFRSFVRPFD